MLAEEIRGRALAIGFDVAGIAPAGEARHADAFRRWLEAGCAGGMTWMGKDADRRVHPAAKSVVVVGLSYFVHEPPPELWNDPLRGRIARYAWGRDYHDVMLPMLKELAASIGATSFRACVDSAPVLERDLAEQAGLGFAGKNTNLISGQFGSYVLIGELLLDAEVSGQRSAVSEDGCGSCIACLGACPTGALVEPYVLDARRCISYLTVENKGAIPVDLRPGMKNWILGCDECQQVCPWNADCAPHPHRFLRFDADTCAPRLAEIMELDEKSFRDRFDGTPVMRARRRGLLRNAAVALGNSGDASALPVLERAARDQDALVREHAQWGVARLRAPTPNAER